MGKNSENLSVLIFRFFIPLWQWSWMTIVDKPVNGKRKSSFILSLSQYDRLISLMEKGIYRSGTSKKVSNTRQIDEFIFWVIRDLLACEYAFNIVGVLYCVFRFKNYHVHWSIYLTSKFGITFWFYNHFLFGKNSEGLRFSRSIFNWHGG